MKYLKVAGLSAVSVFQTVAGSFMTWLVISDVAEGRFTDIWNLSAALASGLMLGIGGIVTGILYGAWALNTKV